MKNLTIRPINTGYVPTHPLQYHYHFSCAPYLKGVPSEKVPLPVFTFLVEGGDKLLLVDTGMAWTERANDYHHPGSWQEPGMAIHEQLEKLGYKPEDIDIVVFTHLHWDHMFYVEKFKNATLIAHEREWEFANNPIPLYYKSYEHPALGITRPFEGLEFTTVSGETEIMPGVRVFETFGHSPGHISVEIDTKNGSYICAGDSIFVKGNLNEIPELHYNISPPGRYYNIVEAWKSIEIQKARAKNSDFLLLCHDKDLEELVKTTPVLGL
ncbi:MAG TPA: N-acyl homoserine lactonase family protein [Clostridiaceae bacterium]|jgi:N-acyl homoserine lactone hydrolase|nr:N-acyl homoserine lactonase family protein [Clostridiaceae bacterium]